MKCKETVSKKETTIQKKQFKSTGGKSKKRDWKIQEKEREHGRKKVGFLLYLILLLSFFLFYTVYCVTIFRGGKRYICAREQDEGENKDIF